VLYEVAWFRAVAALRDVLYRSWSMRRFWLEFGTCRPHHWSVVERPYDAVDLPMSWGTRYAVCPACSHRAPIKGHPMEMLCPRCRGLYGIRMP